MALLPSLTTAAPPPPSPSPSSSPLLKFFLNPNRTNSRIIFLSRTTSISCSADTNQVLIVNRSPTLKLYAAVLTTKSKRKLRPSFNEQIKEKWSVKIDSQRKKFPWQEEDVVRNEATSSSFVVEEVRSEVVEKAVVVVGGSNSRRALPPWFQDREDGKSRSDGVGDDARIRVRPDDDDDDEEEPGVGGSDGLSFVEEAENVEFTEGDVGYREEKGNGFEGVFVCREKDSGGDFDGERDIGAFDDAVERISNDEVKEPAARSVVVGFDYGAETVSNTGVNEQVAECGIGAFDYAAETVSNRRAKEPAAKSVVAAFDYRVNTVSNGEVKEPASRNFVGAFDYRVNSGITGEVKEPAVSVVGVSAVDLSDNGKVKLSENSGPLTGFDRTVDLPWVSKRDREGMENGKRVRSNTMVAEKLIPEHELKRLRNISLRMYERISVGPAGITQDVVDAILAKWRTDEVVKLKFEGLSANNMRRIHEGLERRTGGLVIWRSGGSVVVYRGITYQLPCAQAYNGQSRTDAELLKVSNNAEFGVRQNVAWNYSEASTSLQVSGKSKYIENLSKEEIMDMTELNLLLDGLGPRFYDWSGPEPLPVDADALPSFVPGYRPPFRLLPNGAKRCLGNKQMTSVRRLARSTPPHFALGRNRDLQGLAQAMVKLWQTNAIAKIAIKRGVLNTLNEKMAEELKRLTGGTLVSRNKEYIVFHRGNDFLPHAVTETLHERKKLTELHQDEEELVRQRAAFNFKAKSSKVPLIAGTLAETIAATSRWGNQPTKLEMAKMMKKAAVEKHASLVRYLEKKLILAKAKVAKAEKALRKVQEYLEPKELPTDLEVITDEERFLFRKMGLSMKPFLLVGRRKVFDGTIQNMHLHWKFRELVKLIVKESNFAMVKHIAISLEAESGGVLVSVDKTTKGYAIIIYRGKNYQRPSQMKPKNLLTRRQALARSIELQRREALKHHILDLEEKIDLLKSGLEEMKATNEIGINIEGNDLYARMTSGYFSDTDEGEDEGEEAYLQVDDCGDEDTDVKNDNSNEATDNATRISSQCLNGVTDSGTVKSNLWF